MTKHTKSPAAPRDLRQKLRLPLMIGVPVLAVVAGGALYATGGRYVSTDDAYVQAARTTISSDISGRVVAVLVHDNQQVAAGQPLFQLDDRPFRIAVADAEAKLEAARLKLDGQKAVYRQRLADLASAKDAAEYRSREFERQNRLLASGTVSQSNYDLAAHSWQAARLDVAAAQQQLASALADLGGDADIAPADHPVVKQAQAALDQARLNLSYTMISAPDAGIVTKVEQIQPGDYVNAAAALFSLVSSDRVWVEANFKETDLTHMQAGQAATLAVDAYPDHKLAAHVVSLSPGTGSTFSLLPAENATGNWVKVVQRLPVRLELDEHPQGLRLQAGMSTDVEVDTGHQRKMVSLISHALAAPAKSGE